MPDFVINSDFNKYKKIFLEENSRLNLISKNDEKLLYEKHFYDSLAIKLFFEKYNFIPDNMLDIGTGGGFPSIPVAMEYPDISVVGIDSIRKKISAIEKISAELGLKNIKFINDRVENLTGHKFDLITSRAVGRIDKLVEYSYPLLNEGGYIVLYKSKSAEDEITEAKSLIRKYQLKIKEPIEYTLPLEETYTRCLVLLQK